VEVLTAEPADIPPLQDSGDADSATDTERVLADVLAGVVRVEQVPVDSHFFNDLGADSLVMAQFCARVRKRGDMPAVSMKDIYRHPTIRSLATALDDAAPAPAPTPTPIAAPVPSPSVEAPSPARTPTDVRAVAEGTARAEAQAAARTRRYIVCGVLQFLIFLGYSCLVALAVEEGHQWISAGSGLFDLYLRSVLVAGAGFLGLCALPIVVKWTLVGRWRSGEFPLWGMAYLRFWVVKTLIRISPVRLFAGSPLYVLYLRALGARIGKGVTILSHTIPVCTDLLTIGEGTIIRKDVLLSCYRGHAGVIQTGPVTLGSNVLVSEHTVLDIETSMGDGAQLGHASSLHTGQVVPAGERRHGSPAQPTEVDYRRVAPADCPTAKRTAYGVVQLLSLLAVYLPLALGGVTALLTGLPQLQTLLNPQPMASAAFYVDALIASVVLLFGSLLAGLLVVGTLPRLLSRAVQPGKVYPLYGFHYGIQRAIAVMTNRKSLTTLFGDSSGIVPYLRYLGYDLSRVEQTGSNFGTEVQHENPYLSSVGTGTMIADGLSIMNADFSSTSFRVSRTSIGPHNFLGNRIAYPAQGRTGDNCLLATKVMVPIDGPVREGVGLLGSPSFEIPRTVMRDNRFNHLETGDELRRRLAAKNRHNAATAGLYLLARLIHLFVLTLITMGAVDLYPSFGALAIALASVLTLTYTVVHFALVERASTGFKPQKPLYCSIYEPSFWRHERFWKMASVHYIQAFDGTPFKNVIWRLLGARIGKRVFDDGCFFPERTLVTIGDDSTLNAGTVVQCHSQEDGAFKSDRSALGNGCTLGVGAFVHYGVTIADGAALAPDSFLMKGEEIPSHAQWGGNPAREMPDHKTQVDAGKEPQATQATPARGL
jgi:non-ribosomal peptide synthetase-like protein